MLINGFMGTERNITKEPSLCYILFLLFLPSTYILFWIVPSAFLLFGLFIYDLIVNGLH